MKRQLFFNKDITSCGFILSTNKFIQHKFQHDLFYSSKYSTSSTEEKNIYNSKIQRLHFTLLPETKSLFFHKGTKAVH